jgi:hypothetical protein
VCAEVQPVAIVGDWTNVSPRIDTCDGMDGFAAAVVATQIRGYQLINNSPGGLIVHHFVVYNPGGAGSADDWRFTFGVAAPNPAAVPGVATVPLNPRKPTVATREIYFAAASYLIGQIVRDQTVLGGNFFTTKQAAPQIRGPWYVAPGRAFIIEGFAASVGLGGHIFWTEMEAPAPVNPA